MAAERYSDQTRRAVALAGEEARRLGHGHIGTEHLLLGLLAEGGNGAALALGGAGASLAACREKVAEALASRPAESRGERLSYTARAARALDRAGKLSLRMRSDRVEPAHVLLSVLDVEGTAGQVLRGLAVDLGAVRAAATDSLAGAGGSGAGRAAGAGPDEASGDVAFEVLDDGDAELVGLGPLCPTCGSPLMASLGHVRISAASGAGGAGAGGAGVDFDVAYCTACGGSLGATRA